METKKIMKDDSIFKQMFDDGVYSNKSQHFNLNHPIEYGFFVLTSLRNEHHTAYCKQQQRINLILK